MVNENICNSCGTYDCGKCRVYIKEVRRRRRRRTNDEEGKQKIEKREKRTIKKRQNKMAKRIRSTVKKGQQTLNYKNSVIKCVSSGRKKTERSMVS